MPNIETTGVWGIVANAGETVGAIDTVVGWFTTGGRDKDVQGELEDIRQVISRLNKSELAVLKTQLEQIIELIDVATRALSEPKGDTGEKKDGKPT